MKTNLLTIRVAQTAVAFALLTVLAGCQTGGGISPRNEIPTGPEDGSATLPANSGPHQFPLAVHTDKEFYPDPKERAKVYIRDNKAIIVVPGKLLQATNSGPHQGPGGGN